MILKKDKQKINKNVSSTPKIKDTDINKSKNNTELSDEEENYYMGKSIDKVDDYKTSGSVTIIDTKGVKHKTNPNDTTLSFKDDGLLDKRLTSLYKIMNDVNNNILNLVKINSNPSQPNNLSMVNVSNSSGGQSYGGINSILNYRIECMRLQDSNRVC